MKTPTFLDLSAPSQHSPIEELAHGLLAPSASIAPKFFYDDLGSHLFEAITQLAEYYPTRSEASLLQAHGAEIFGALQAGIPLVELGAGSCRKAETVLRWTQVSSYTAVEIAAAFARAGLERLQQQFPDLTLQAIGTDFSEHLRLPDALRAGPVNLFYAGSSIGNFAPDSALRLLRSMHAVCAGGMLVIGVDTVKDRSTLEAAYDDALGVTAAFNLNVLRHCKRVLGSDFDPRSWRHRAFYNEARQRIEMHLEARHRLAVAWPGHSRQFAEGEQIHTEHSYKWTPAAFIALLETAGFCDVEAWDAVQPSFAIYRARSQRSA